MMALRSLASSSRRPRHDPSRRWARCSMLAVEALAGLSAVGGGIGLIATEGLGIPSSALDHSPFTSFVGPGLLLTFAVGGSLLGAAGLVWRRHPAGPLASLLAGGILLGWIGIEAIMVRSGRELQIVVAGLALLTIALAWPLWRGDTSGKQAG